MQLHSLSQSDITTIASVLAAMLKLSAQHVKTRQIATAHNQAINKRLDRIEAAIKVIRCDLDEIMGKKAPGG